MRRTHWLALALVAVTATAVGLLGPAALAGSSKKERPRLQGVNFVSTCGFSHRNMDDPIVYPNQPGLSHDHTFVANRSTNAASTTASLQAARTTCRRRGDTAAYWMPTLFVEGKALGPMGATIYYRRKTRAEVTPFPSGLKVIAGSSHAMTPQDRRITFWNCGAQVRVPPSSTVPMCPDVRGSALRLHVTFPNCWDGKNLDSADHQSHMAYSDRGTCPSTHPVAVPAISLIYRYPTLGGSGVTLASGGQYSAHADFFNAWNQQALTRLVDGCLNALRHCGRGA